MSISYVKRDDINVYWTDAFVNINLLPEEMKLTEEEINKVKDYWEEEISRNTSLFNGKTICVDHACLNNNAFTLDLKISDYSHYVYVMNHLEENISVCSSLAAGALIITSDDYIVLGKMGKETSFPGIIQCIGGGMTQTDIEGTEPSVHTVIRECYEEIGIIIKKDNIDYSRKYLCIRKKASTIGFCYIVYLDISKEELERHFAEYKDPNCEIVKLIYIENKPDQVREFCKQDMLIDYLKKILYDFAGIEYLDKLFTFSLND